MIKFLKDLEQGPVDILNLNLGLANVKRALLKGQSSRGKSYLVNVLGLVDVAEDDTQHNGGYDLHPGDLRPGSVSRSELLTHGSLVHAPPDHQPLVILGHLVLDAPNL